MRTQRRWRWAFNGCVWAYWIAVALAAVLTAVKEDAVGKWGLVDGFRAWIESRPVGVTIGVLMAIPVLEALQKKIGPPTVWEAVQALLDAVQEQTYDAHVAEPQHLHRVTLFKHVGWRWVTPYRCARANGRIVGPTSGWLVPMARSGALTQRTKTCFLADDSGSFEGIAGKTWVATGDISVEGLPDLRSDPSGDAIRRYAVGSQVEASWVKARLDQQKPCARSILGTTVTVGGKPWGVIVYDTAAEKLPRRSRTPALNGAMLKVFDRLLERV